MTVYLKSVSKEAKDALDTLFEEHLGQSFQNSIEDRQGCNMGRANPTWMCPQLIATMVVAAIEELWEFAESGELFDG